jgi:acetyltransferase-like isoleucine patch superfamily enzyme
MLVSEGFYRIYPLVFTPDDAEIEDFVVLGKPPRNTKAGELPLILGAGCVIRSHTVIYAGNTIGERLQTGHHVVIRESNTIGDHVSIGTHSIVEHHVTIGNHVRLHSRVFVPEYSTLEDGCWLGPGVMVTNARYPISRGAKDRLEGAYIEQGAMIGANATLLPGVRIGAKALVGAGSVVTKDVPPGAVVVGNPARVINSVDNIAYYRAEEES